MVSLNNKALKDIDAFKVADLFQNLDNLILKEREPQSGFKNQNEIEMIVPNTVRRILDEFEQAQNKFIQGIDQYLHRNESMHKKSELETDETIVKNCPGFLCSMNYSGALPIHCVLRSNLEADYIPMLVKHGSKYNVGGKHGRGGLLVKNKYANKNALECITNVETLQILANSDPPLFYKRDILKYNLLHTAVTKTNMALAKWLIAQCPSALYHTDNIPLRYCRGPGMIKLCLEEAIKYYPSHPSFGGLLVKNGNNTFVIQEFQNNDSLLKAIAQVMSQHKHLPILHKVIDHTPELVDKIIIFCPHASIIRDEFNRLPIHAALQRGMKTSMSLSSMLLANAQQLGEMDPVTKFCPSALAAMSPACDLNTIYHLIRAHPDHVEVGGRKHGRPSMPDSKAPHSRKRQKK